MHMATQYVPLLRAAGRDDEADAVLARGMAAAQEYPLKGIWGRNYFGSGLYALNGEYDKALDELEALFDAGLTLDYWWRLDYEPAFDSLRDDSRFQALRARVAADMAQVHAEIKKTSGIFDF